MYKEIAESSSKQPNIT